MKKQKQNIITFAIAMLCCALWGSAFPMIKVGYGVFDIPSNDTGTIILFAGVRFFLAGIITIVIFSIATKSFLIPSKKSFAPITVLSLFQTVLQYLFFYLGLAYTTGEKASIINGSSCVIALFVACLVFKSEHINVQKVLASLLCFAGVIVSSVSLSSHNGINFSLGDACILMSALSYSFSSGFLKKYSEHYSPYMLSGYQFVLGGAVMIAVGLIMHGRLDFGNIKGIVIIIYLALVSAIAYSLWGVLLKHNPVSRIAVFGSMTPIFGYFLSVAILHSSLDNAVQNLCALALVVVGIICINISKNNK